MAVHVKTLAEPAMVMQYMTAVPTNRCGCVRGLLLPASAVSQHYQQHRSTYGNGEADNSNERRAFILLFGGGSWDPRRSSFELCSTVSTNSLRPSVDWYLICTSCLSTILSGLSLLLDATKCVQPDSSPLRNTKQHCLTTLCSVLLVPSYSSA